MALNAKRILMNVMITVLALLMAGGAGLGTYLLLNPDRGENVVEAYIDEGENSTSVRFEDLGIIPGEQTEYTVEVYCEFEGEYDVELSFKQNDGDRSGLEDHVYAKLEIDGEEICDVLLAELLYGKTLTLKDEFKEGEPLEIDICYYMKEDVGNEAQEAEVEFELVVTVSNTLD